MPNVISCPHCGNPISDPSATSLDILIDTYPWPPYYGKIRRLSLHGKFKTFGDLARATESDLRREPEMGDATIKAIKIELRKYGLGLGMLRPKI